MASYIFASGTTTKANIYSTMLSALTSAGWTNVSSNSATDFDVLTSPGTSGNQSLVIQLRPTDATTGAGANNTTTTDYSLMSYRLVESYTPGASGTAGTFGRSSEAWVNLYIAATTAATTTSRTTNVNYKFHANANRLIFSIEYPNATNIPPILIYMGLPDVTYCSEPGSRGVLVATNYQSKYSGSIHITDAAGEMPSLSVSTSKVVYCTLTPKNPNSAGQYMFSDIFYGDTSEGMRGKLSGIYALPNTAVLSGDSITVGTSSYYVLVLGSGGNTAFPTTAIAIQMA